MGAFYCPEEDGRGKAFVRAILGGGESGGMGDALTTANGRSALMLAAQRGAGGMVAALLAAGVDPALVSPRDGVTAAGLARAAGHHSIAIQIDGDAPQSQASEF